MTDGASHPPTDEPADAKPPVEADATLESPPIAPADPADDATATALELPASRRRRRLWMIGLLVLTAVVYAQTLTFPYVNWDDPIFILENPYVQSFSGEHVARVFTPRQIDREMIYVPLHYVSFMLETIVAGRSPLLTHLVNLLLHLANVGLAFHVLMRLGGRMLPALLAAAAFAIHPVQAEAVAWAMGRKDLLSTLFGLLCLLAYLRFQETRGPSWLAASWLAFTLGILSKPTIIVLPAVLLLLDYIRLPRLSIRDLQNKIAFLAVAIAVYMLNQAPAAAANADEPSRSLVFAAVHGPWVLWHWFRRLALAEPVLAIYPLPGADANSAVILITGAIAVGLLLALFWWAWRRRDRASWAGLGFAAITALPAASVLLSARDFATADRYGYFPLIGFFFALACLVDGIRARVGRRAAIAIVVVWLLVAAGLNVYAARAWSDSRVLWERVVHQHPDSLLAWQHLCLAYAVAGDVEQADAAFQRTLELDPLDLGTRANYGFFLLEQGRLVSAQDQFQQVLRARGDHGHPRAERGLALVRAAKIAELRDTLAQNGDSPQAPLIHIALGTLLMEDGQLAEAETQLRDAISAGAGDQTGLAYYQLGLLHRRQNRPTSARTAFEGALLASPPYLPAREQLQELEANGH